MAGRTCLNTILIPLQSLVSCFLEPPANRRAAVHKGQISFIIQAIWGYYCKQVDLKIPNKQGYLLSD